MVGGSDHKSDPLIPSCCSSWHLTSLQLALPAIVRRPIVTTACLDREQRNSHAASAGYQTRLPGYSGHARAVRGAVDPAIADVRRQGSVRRPRDRYLGVAASLEEGLCRAAA